MHIAWLVGRLSLPNTMEKIGKPKISYHKDYDEAFKSSGFWRATSLKNAFDLDISDPRELEEKAKREVSDEKLKESTIIVTSIEECIKPIEEYFKIYENLRAKYQS